MSDVDISPWLTQLRKGAAELAVLAALGDDTLYGLELLEAVNRGEEIVSEGSIYPLLSRLEKDGKLSSRWSTQDSAHPRKYFQLTAEGRAILEAMQLAWIQFRQAISAIVEHAG